MPNLEDAGAERPGATERGIAAYTPEAMHRRSGLALCLSGGGFRAALFHLGALRRLNELGLLSKIDTISTVSGGSIVAAHLADRIRPWPQAKATVPDWEASSGACRAIRPFRKIRL